MEVSPNGFFGSIVAALDITSKVAGASNRSLRSPAKLLKHHEMTVRRIFRAPEGEIKG
jgi:hypothetical protein